MQTVVEIRGWEHECCGPSYERDAVVDLGCLVLPDGNEVARYLESHHDVGAGQDRTRVAGRVVDIGILHPDGTIEKILRLPSGHALRGTDEADDGHLEHPWTGESVINDSDRYLITISN